MKQGARNRSVVVSIHDVSPLTWVRTEEMLVDFSRTGVDRVSLLVIPDHHRKGRISQDAAFVAWLQEKRDVGHEVVLHGYEHLRPAKASDGSWTRFVAQCYTAGEGEFLDLSEADARLRLARGEEELAACGVRSRGFIAPAWLLGVEGERAVRGAGFEYTTRIGEVSDFSTDRRYASRSLVWSVRSGWRRVCSLGWNAIVLQRERGNSLLRIGVHPPDWGHPAIRQQILRICGGVLAERAANTYEGWIDHKRSFE